MARTYAFSVATYRDGHMVLVQHYTNREVESVVERIRRSRASGATHTVTRFNVGDGQGVDDLAWRKVQRAAQGESA